MFKKSDYKTRVCGYCGSNYKGDLRTVFRCEPINNSIKIADGDIMIYDHKRRKIYTDSLRLSNVSLLKTELWTLLRNTKKIIKIIKSSNFNDNDIKILEDCHNMSRNAYNINLIKIKYARLYKTIMMLWQYDDIISKITNNGSYQSYGDSIRIISNTDFNDKILRLLILPIALDNVYGNNSRYYMYGSRPAYYYMVDNKIYTDRHLHLIKSYKSVMVFPMHDYRTVTCNAKLDYNTINMIYNIGTSTPRLFANSIRKRSYE